MSYHQQKIYCVTCLTRFNEDSSLNPAPPESIIAAARQRDRGYAYYGLEDSNDADFLEVYVATHVDTRLPVLVPLAFDVPDPLGFDIGRGVLKNR